ncbi:hypothetical protein AB6A40_007267 [Gnathostoma spinigerum]|uniref:Myotrophin n=1 Tax=Gnathostoma spinigerum TaxID=75299 RepID=A0ABD6EKQ8_9BILA
MDDNCETISWIIKNGDLCAVKKNIDSGNVNMVIDGRNPIHIAADYGHPEIVEYLISSGADINALDIHGMTPLLAAVFEGHKNIIKLLLAKGARKDILAPDGRMVVDCAEQDDVKQILLL